jgi:hypothetical protein
MATVLKGFQMFKKQGKKVETGFIWLRNGNALNLKTPQKLGYCEI